MRRNQRIKNALKEKGISQEVLAKHLGTTQAAVGKQLNKKEEIDSLNFIRAVATLTGISIEYFIEESTSSLAEESSSVYVSEKDRMREELTKLQQENQILRGALREIGTGAGGGGGNLMNRNVG